MTRRPTLLALFVWGSAAALPVSAQQADSATVYRIPGIDVGATRAGTTVGGTSALDVTPDSLPLPVGASVEELFRRVPGLHVRTNSRGEAEVSVLQKKTRRPGRNAAGAA